MDQNNMSVGSPPLRFELRPGLGTIYMMAFNGLLIGRDRMDGAGSRG